MVFCCWGGTSRRDGKRPTSTSAPCGTVACRDPLAGRRHRPPARHPSRRHPARAARARARAGRAPGQIRRACTFLGQRFVGRRRAADGGRDVDIGQRQAVVGAKDTVGRPARPGGGWPQEVARGVAGEHAAGAFPAVRRRCQATMKDRALGIAEPGTGRPQYVSSRNGPPSPARPVAPLDDPGAAPADHDLGVGEGRQGGPAVTGAALSSRRETTNNPAKPTITRYRTLTSRIGETAPIVSARMRSTPDRAASAGRSTGAVPGRSRSGRTCLRTGTGVGRRAG